MRLRAFGTAERDLALDLRAQNRAALVTRLLQQCTDDPHETVPEGFYRELSAGRRLECLLVLAAGGPDKRLSLSYKCRACGEELDLELTLEELAALQREADTIETVGVELNGQRVEFRKPRGSDQEAWAAMDFHDEAAAVAGIVDTLLIDRRALKTTAFDSFDAIETALDEADPLIDFKCRVLCGECGEPNECRVDLMETALGMLMRTQHQMVVALHRLASHYHWTEQEIFAVPDWRRRQYLQLIAASGKS